MQYPLRDVDEGLWRAARIKTTTDGITIKDVIVRALELYVKDGQGALWPEKKTTTPKRRTA